MKNEKKRKQQIALKALLFLTVAYFKIKVASYLALFSYYELVVVVIAAVVVVVRFVVVMVVVIVVVLAISTTT